MPSHVPEGDKIKHFIQSFYDFCVTFSDEYYKRLKDGLGKEGKSAELLSKILGLGNKGTEAIEHWPKVVALMGVALTQLGVNAFAVHQNRLDLVKLTAILYKFFREPLKYRETVVYSAATVFLKYEPLLLKVVTRDESMSWERGLEKVAHDAVNRLFNYLKKNPQDDISVNLFTMGVILGQSKRYKSPSGFPNFHRGHKNLKINGLKIKTTFDLFGKVGLIKGSHFYVKESADGYGFRASFDWENSPTYDMSTYTETNQPPSPSPSFILEGTVNEITSNALETLKDIQNDNLTLKKEIMKEAQIMADKFLQKIGECNTEINSTLESIILNLADIEKSLDIIQKTTTKTDVTVNEVLRGQKGQIELEEKIYVNTKELKKHIDEVNVETEIWFKVEDPIGFLTDRSEKIQELREFFKQNRVVAVRGLGGSELARQYLKQHGKDFHNVLWINSENETLLLKSFFEIARIVSISECYKNREKYLETIIGEVVEYFETRLLKNKTLFVLDNADISIFRFKDLFVPMENSAQEVRILITTSEHKFSDSRKIVTVKNLPPNKVMELVREKLDKEVEEQQVEKLVELLQNFPLALHQAIAHIINENRSKRLEKLSVKNFLDKLTKEVNSFLRSESEMENNDQATMTVVKVTMDQIKEEETLGNSACEILNVMALLGPGEIKRDWFSALIKNKNNFKSAIDLLKCYPTIYVFSYQDQSLLHIHQLVRKVVLVELDKSGQTMEVFKKAYNLLQQNNPTDMKAIMETRLQCELHYHYEHLYDFLTKRIPGLQPEKKKEIEQKYLVGIIRSMADACSVLRQINSQIHLLKELLIVMGDSCEKKEVGAVNFDLGTCYARLRSYKKAAEYFKMAFDQLLENDDRPLRALALLNLASCNYKTDTTNLDSILSLFQNFDQADGNTEMVEERHYLIWGKTMAKLGPYRSKCANTTIKELKKHFPTFYEAFLKPDKEILVMICHSMNMIYLFSSE